MRTEEIIPILLDQKLARLGDAFVNFVYSLALTRSTREPVGIKVSDKVLARAAQEAGIRQLLPKRTTRDHVSNAVESLIVYVWLQKYMTIDEISAILEVQRDQPYDSFKVLLQKILSELIDKSDSVEG